MKPMEIISGLILGGIIDLDDMLDMRPDTLIPLDRLSGRIWQTGFRGEIVYYPILDRDVLPEDVLERLVDEIVSRIHRGKRIALFCLGGYGRTGYVAACVLFRLGIHDPMSFMWTHYSAAAIETDGQIMAVTKYCKHHVPEADDHDPCE